MTFSIERNSGIESWSVHLSSDAPERELFKQELFQREIS
jgi:hypothetical protein